MSALLSSPGTRTYFGNQLTKKEADCNRCHPTQADSLLFHRVHHKIHKKDDDALSCSTFGSHLESVATPGPPEVSARVKSIVLGSFEIDAWYSAPFPEEYITQPLLYFCEFCLKYMKSAYTAYRHFIKCLLKHPPGHEIYRNGRISVFEVDGRKNKIYCQNLCLIAKLFLDHKTLYYDVEPFLFYVMTELDTQGFHLVGYFSKEKRSSNSYNLSCIMVLPIHQRKGYGHFLIDFSYLLSRKEGKVGSPEKPLSDLGLLSYKTYWRTAVFKALQELAASEVSIRLLSTHTGLTPDDVITILQSENMLVKDQGQYVLAIDWERVQQVLHTFAAKNYPAANPDGLHWTPFILKASLPSPEGLTDAPE